MKFILYKGLDGKEYKLYPKKYSKNTRKCSSYHEQAREVIKEIFPSFLLLEEVRLKGTKHHGMLDLIADFVIYDIPAVVEVHGKQHFKYTPYFHKNKAAFIKQKIRDRRKKMWCETNEFPMIELNYNEDVDDWKQKIKHRLCNED